MKFGRDYKLLKKYILTFLLIFTFTLFFLFFHIIGDSQSKVTLKVKTLLPKDVRFF